MRARARGGRVRRDRDLHAVGHPPGLGARGLPRTGCGSPRSAAPAHPPARVLADGDRAHVRRLAACRRARSSRGCATPGSARRRAPPPRCCTTASASGSRPNKLPVARWVEIIEASHAPACARPSTVMFGHIEEPWELAEHMRVIRDAAGAHRRHHRVRAAVVHPVPHAARAARTASRRSRARRTSSTPRSSGSRSAASIRNVQASWVKMGLDTATEALRWGVNDLGGTLMEESISPHGRLLPRRQARSPRPDRRRARAGRPAAERTTLYEPRASYPVPAARAA